jgi:molybdenum cofactor cytidylyltransferase
MRRNKLLIEIKGRTVLDRVLDAIDASKVDEVLVVLGHRPEDLTPIVEAHFAEAVLNPDYEEGMTSSFQAGIRLTSGDAAFLCLGDQPMLEANLMDDMMNVLETYPDALMVSPVHEGRRGHPVLFRRDLFPEILGLGLETNLKEILLKNEKRLVEVEGEAWCTLDMDTPEDYERIRGFLEGSCDSP